MQRCGWLAFRWFHAGLCTRCAGMRFVGLIGFEGFSTRFLCFVTHFVGFLLSFFSLLVFVCCLRLFEAFAVFVLGGSWFGCFRLLDARYLRLVF